MATVTSVLAPSAARTFSLRLSAALLVNVSPSTSWSAARPPCTTVEDALGHDRRLARARAGHQRAAA